MRRGGRFGRPSSRTAVGVRPDGSIVMAVIDGRQAASGKEGVFGDEMAAIMKNTAAPNYNLDGGGSSTMIIRKDGELVVVNSPSDGRERSDANCLLIAVRMPEIRMEFTPGRGRDNRVRGADRGE